MQGDAPRKAFRDSGDLYNDLLARKLTGQQADLAVQAIYAAQRGEYTFQCVDLKTGKRYTVTEVIALLGLSDYV